MCVFVGGPAGQSEKEDASGLDEARCSRDHRNKRISWEGDVGHAQMERTPAKPWGGEGEGEGPFFLFVTDSDGNGSGEARAGRGQARGGTPGHGPALTPSVCSGGSCFLPGPMEELWSTRG